ncbi:nucleotidyltransferase domain-containing protein [Flavobacterium sp.]|uniref:nucleotidyltransferase domain-containing protein n=1 Tax=Flavobacterium sp. TaxID=239 RepID=UPI003D1214BA
MKILQPLLYFNLFQHPLTEEEIFHFSSLEDIKHLQLELQNALSKQIIQKTEEFYHLHLNQNNIKKRRKGNLEAKKVMKIAKQKAEFIFKYFPFIEGVAISGSLSKGYFDKDSDIDFFIITQKNRLWFCKMILMVYKKTFLFNSKKFFCINYLVSNHALEIKDKNRFTATEIATMIPMQGTILNDFFEINNWYKQFYPNKKITIDKLLTSNKTYFRSAFEKLTNNVLGDWLETISFKIIFNFWKLKYQNKMTSEDFELAFKSSKEVSKHHPSNYQKKVIDKLNLDYKEVKEKHNIEFPLEHA